MLGNRVKRKLDEDEEGLEEDGSMLKASCRRQMVLNMSLMKLYGSQTGPPTGPRLALQHRVLISNIVRRIHADFRQEGGVGALFFSGNYLQLPPSPVSIFSSPLLGLDSSLTPASLLEQDLPTFFTPRPIEEMKGLPPFSSITPSPPPARLLFDVIMKEEQPPPSPPSLPSSPASYLTNFSLDDILCADIDTSVYNLCPSPSAGRPSKMAAAATDDPVWAMSGYDAVRAQNQPFKMELADLDHVMEVLVGS